MAPVEDVKMSKHAKHSAMRKKKGMPKKMPGKMKKNHLAEVMKNGKPSG